MDYDLEGHLAAVERSLSAEERDGRPARAVILAHTLAAPVEDVWAAATDPNRLSRWFLPISGDLRPGGRYQLEGNAGDVMTAVMGWIDENLGGAAGRVVMTGASAGGVGVFHAALAVPDRVGGIIAMPGRYSGEASLAALADAPVWMMVGEGDTNWVSRSEATAEQLEAAGVEVTHEVLPGQGHVLRVSQDELVSWIEGR